MDKKDIALIAHLMRRAGFGATRSEIQSYLAKGYETTVEELLHPENPANLPDDVIRRYHGDQSELRRLDSAGGYWMYRMITSQCPLEEKIALFWHSLFATGYAKLNQARSLLNQIDMFRNHGLGTFDNLLVELSKDPAMIVWLDNNENHKGSINENYGRELLELFSMGIGNYTESDIKECSRAFTGWTLKNAEYMSVRAQKDSIWPYSRIAWHFEYREDDHDNGMKTFLGETGNFNGDDIVNIIVKQESTARFVSTRLYQFFVADEINSEGEKLIKSMMESYFNSNYEIRSVLRTLFTSEHFKSEQVRFTRVKGPAELVVGAVRIAGTYRTPTLGVHQLAQQAFYMGQGLLQPPTVEGWHEGQEWIDSGALVERVNFASKEISNICNPGIKNIIEYLAENADGIFTPEQFVNECLDIIGPIDVSNSTYTALLNFASEDGDINLRDHRPGDISERRVGQMLRLITSTREFQLA